MRRPVRALAITVAVALAFALALIAFHHGQAAECGYYKGRGGPQWAIDKYCGPQK